MGIIIVTLLVTIIIAVLLYIGTLAILTVSPWDVWEHPQKVLSTVGEMSERAAQVHIGMFATTFALLFLLAIALVVIHLLRRQDTKRKELAEQIVTVAFYIVFFLFLGNGIVYVFNLLIKFNPSL